MPYLPSNLVSRASLEKIEALSAALPISSNFGFECRMGSELADADFLVAVIPSDGSRAAWANQNSSSCFATELRMSGAWSMVLDLLEGWHRGDRSLEPIHDTWLEFDIDPNAPGLPEPSFFFGFDDTLTQNHPELAESLVNRLLGSQLGGSAQERLRSCFAALPPRAVIFQVGVMLPRKTDEVRLCLRGLEPAEIPTYLRQVGWPGSCDELRGFLAEISPLTDAVGLDLSVGDAVMPQIGFEFEIKSGASGKRKLNLFLRTLVDLGLCLEAKGDAILGWLGYSTEHSDRTRWPAHLLKASEAFGGDVASTFVRTLNHIKIGYQEGRPTSAKAYLGVRHFWGRTVKEASA